MSDTIYRLPGVASADLDRFAKKIGEYAIQRGFKKGFTTGQIGAAFLNVAAELSAMFHTTEESWNETARLAFLSASQRLISNQRPEGKVVVEFVKPPEVA